MIIHSVLVADFGLPSGKAVTDNKDCKRRVRVPLAHGSRLRLC